MALTDQPGQPVDDENKGDENNAVYMDDPTGSDGGSTEPKPDKLTDPDADAGPVDPAISGSTGDSATAQSAGRSQY